MISTKILYWINYAILSEFDLFTSHVCMFESNLDDPWPWRRAVQWDISHILDLDCFKIEFTTVDFSIIRLFKYIAVINSANKSSFYAIPKQKYFLMRLQVSSRGLQLIKTEVFRTMNQYLSYPWTATIRSLTEDEVGLNSSMVWVLTYLLWDINYNTESGLSNDSEVFVKKAF